MHELSVTQSLVNIANAEGEKVNAKRVTKIKMVLGAFSGLVPACIQEYFDLLSEGCICEKAKLEFTRIPAIIECEKCGKKTELTHFRLVCGGCGSRHVKLIQGREFYIESLEVEDADTED